MSNRRTSYRTEIDGEYGIVDGAVRILDAATGEEVLAWDSSEWTEDPSLMYVIANAIETAHSDPELFTSRLPADRR